MMRCRAEKLPGGTEIDDLFILISSVPNNPPGCAEGGSVTTRPACWPQDARNYLNSCRCLNEKAAAAGPKIGEANPSRADRSGHPGDAQRARTRFAPLVESGNLHPGNRSAEAGSRELPSSRVRREKSPRVSTARQRASYEPRLQVSETRFPVPKQESRRELRRHPCRCQRVQATLTGAADSLADRHVLSGERIVNTLKSNTIRFAFLQAGSVGCRVVRDGQHCFWSRPRDFAEDVPCQAGQEALVKLTAYDFSIFRAASKASSLECIRRQAS